MRPLNREPTSLTVMELQSAGARRSRVTNKSLQEGRRANKTSHTRSEQQATVCTTSRPSLTTRTSPANRRHRAASKGARTTTRQRRTNQKNTQEGATQSEHAQPNTRTQRAASKGGAPKPSRHQEKPSEYIKDWKVYEPQRVPWHGREFKGREFKGCLQHQILESRALPMATERVC